MYLNCNYIYHSLKDYNYSPLKTPVHCSHIRSGYYFILLSLVFYIYVQKYIILNSNALIYENMYFLDVLCDMQIQWTMCLFLMLFLIKITY